MLIKMVFQEFRMLEKLERLIINLKEFGELKPVVCRRSSESNGILM
jgi:hypothetical protein